MSGLLALGTAASPALALLIAVKLLSGRLNRPVDQDNRNGRLRVILKAARRKSHVRMAVHVVDRPTASRATAVPAEER